VTGTAVAAEEPLFVGERIGPATASCPSNETLVNGGGEVTDTGESVGALAKSYENSTASGGTWTVEGVVVAVPPVPTPETTAVVGHVTCRLNG
jgi:hypothetical protein